MIVTTQNGETVGTIQQKTETNALTRATGNFNRSAMCHLWAHMKPIYIEGKTYLIMGLPTSGNSDWIFVKKSA